MLLALIFALQAAGSDTVGARLQFIADSLLRARPRIPGMLVHVEIPKAGKRWTIASGFSDTATKAPLRTSQPVRVASNTKTYTASAILRLVERGTIALGDPIEKHLPADLTRELRRGGIAVDRITIDHLLSHRSGLDEHPSVPSYIPTIASNPAKRWTRLEQVQWLVDSLKPVGAPGEKFRYSDTGYILLGAIVERYTGKNFGAGVRELVGLDRLGLRGTWMETLEPEPAGIAPRAHQYMSGGDTFGLDPSFDLYGGGGIAATVSDMAAFTTAVLTGRVFEKPATLDSMMVMRSSALYDGYGYGLFRVNVGGRRGYGHSGFWGTISVHFPAEGVTIAVAETEQTQTGVLFVVLREALKAVAPVAPGGTLFGRVESEVFGGAALARAEVIIPGLRLSTRADSAGQYRVEGIAPGRHWVVVRAIGHTPAGDSLAIGAGTETAHMFALARVTVLDTVVTAATRYISPALRGVDERRKLGAGRFITEEELRRSDSRKLSDVVRRLPGLQLQRIGQSTYVVSTRNNKAGRRAFDVPREGDPRRCYATIYLDGVLMYDLVHTGGQPPRNIDDFGVTQLAAVEFYAGDASLPVQFRSSECGTLLLWTRER